MKLDGFLLAIAFAVVAALVAPGIGANGGYLPMGAITSLGIALVFFLHGSNLAPSALRAGATNWKLNLCVHGTTFVLFPLMGLALYYATAGFLPDELRVGLFFLCAVSSTISTSIALVGIAGGNLGAAVFSATLSGLAGMVLTPLLMLGIGIVAKDTSALVEAFGDVALQLLLPFAAGQLMRPFIGGWVGKQKALVSKLDRSVIVLIVYASFCDSTQAGLWSRIAPGTLAAVVVLVAGLFGAGLLATMSMSRILRFSREDEITTVFCGSKKSLANGAPIAKIIFGSSPALGAILLPLMIYHQLQLIVCASMARRYAERGQRLDQAVQRRESH